MLGKARLLPLGLALVLLVCLTLAPTVSAGPQKKSVGFTSLFNLGSIRGLVYDDLSANGVRDPQEPPIAGVRILLEHQRSGTVVSAATDEDGRFAFSGLAAGSYLITEEDTLGYCSTTPNNRLVELGYGEEALIDFGDMLLIPGCFRSVAGQVFEDLNANGESDEGEPPLPDVLISLTGENGLAPVVQVSDQFGRYHFRDLIAGTYTVVEVNPRGYTSTTPDQVEVVVEGPIPIEVHFGDVGIG